MSLGVLQNIQNKEKGGHLSETETSAVPGILSLLSSVPNALGVICPFRHPCGVPRSGSIFPSQSQPIPLTTQLLQS